MIDRRAKANRDALLFHHPQIEKAADFRFHEHEGRVPPPSASWIERFGHDPDFHTSVAICFDNEELALEIGLRLLPALDSTLTRVAVRMAPRGADSRI